MNIPLGRVQSLIGYYEKLESDMELFLREKGLWVDFLEWIEFREEIK